MFEPRVQYVVTETRKGETVLRTWDTFSKQKTAQWYADDFNKEEALNAKQELRKVRTVFGIAKATTTYEAI